MATPIRVGVLDAGEARDLVEALAVRGLIGTMSETEGACVVELNEPHEETDRLLTEVVDALEAWLLDRGRPGVEVRVGGRVIPVEPSERLDEALHTRLPRSARRRGSER